jgi:hypothetical protein
MNDRIRRLGFTARSGVVDRAGRRPALLVVGSGSISFTDPPYFKEAFPWPSQE